MREQSSRPATDGKPWRVAVLVITGAEALDAQTGATLGEMVDCALLKPFDDDDVHEAVSRALARRR